MSRKKGVIGWISYYFEYDKLAEYIGKVAFALGFLLYVSTVITLFVFSNATIMGAIGKATLYIIAVLCVMLLAYLIPIEPVKKPTTVRRSKTTPKETLSRPRIIAVVTLLSISLLCYIVLCIS